MQESILGSIFGATSVSGFATVPDSQQNNLPSVETIKDHISALTELGDPLTEFRWKVVDWTAYLRVSLQGLDALTNAVNRPLRGGRAFRNEKIVKPRNVMQGCL